jgi:hypothetical protein
LLIWGGFVRGNTFFVALLSLIFAVVLIFVDYGDISWSTILFVVFIGSMGVNRLDLAETLYKGRWWWKAEDELKD